MHLGGIFYEQTKDASGVILSGRCKIKKYKVFYRYSKVNSISAFKKHADKHMAKNEEPQYQSDPRLVQSVINTNGSITHQRYDEKKYSMSLPGILSYSSPYR
jgi:hypothetical protein